MIQVLISISMAVFSVLTLQVSLNLGSINRLFSSLSYGVVEKSIVVLSNNEDTKPYFDISVFKELVCQFLDQSLEKYTHDYSVSFYYYDVSTNEQSLAKYVDGAAINLKANIVGIVNYNRTITLEML